MAKTQTSQKWLDDLEHKVEEAAERLHSLRDENEELKARIQELEGRVEELEAAAEGDGGEAWTEEREEIRERVEKLVDHLAGLLEE